MGLENQKIEASAPLEKLPTKRADKLVAGDYLTGYGAKYVDLEHAGGQQIILVLDNGEKTRPVDRDDLFEVDPTK